MAARAADVEVSPTLLDLSADEPRGTMTVRNGGSDRVQLTAQPATWAQTAAGEMRLAPADDLRVFPAMVTLAPGEERNLRVGAEARAGLHERSWRIVLEELPPPERAGAPAQVRVLSRITLPVFLAPLRPLDAGEVAGLRLERRRVRFSLRNTGTVRLRPRTLQLVARGSDGAPVLSRALDAWYVLAGDGRLYEAVVPAGDCARIRRLEVEVSFAGERAPLRAQALPGGGACEP